MASLSNLSDIKVRVNRYQVYLSPVLDVFQVQIETETFQASRTFGSESELRTFIKGLETGCQMLSGVFIWPEIPERPTKRFDEARTPEKSEDEIPL